MFSTWFSLIHLSLETSAILRKVETQKHARTNTHTLSSYQDPRAIGPPACNGERSQTTFLTPDGFVQTPWKPHTPRIHRRSASSTEKEETLAATLSLSLRHFYKPSAFCFQSHLQPLDLCCSLFLFSNILLFVYPLAQLLLCQDYLIKTRSWWCARTWYLLLK